MHALDQALTPVVRADNQDPIEEDEDPPDDLAGLYYPLDYVIQTWVAKRNHNILPEPGGLNDQDWRLVLHDWPIVNERYNYLSRSMYPGEGKQALHTRDVEFHQGNRKHARDLF